MTLYIRAHTPEIKSLLEAQIIKHRWTDSGFDIPMLAQSVNLDKYIHSFGLGISVAALDILSVPVPCLFLPRSSIYKSPFRLANSIGLIDAGYRGEAQMKVDILHTPEHQMNDTNVTMFLEHGSRYFQIVQHNFLPWKRIILVDELPAANDDRGAGGFGSTGVSTGAGYGC